MRAEPHGRWAASPLFCVNVSIFAPLMEPVWLLLNAVARRDAQLPHTIISFQCKDNTHWNRSSCYSGTCTTNQDKLDLGPQQFDVLLVCSVRGEHWPYFFDHPSYAYVSPCEGPCVLLIGACTTNQDKLDLGPQHRPSCSSDHSIGTQAVEW